MKTGDRVKCVNKSDDEDCPLVVGRDYIVYSTKNCIHEKAVDVGFIADTGTECRMGCVFSKYNGIWWFDERLFRKVEEKVNYVKLEIQVEEPCLN